MNPKQRLRNEADKIWYEKHLEENCEICGCSEHLQVHHFYYKSSYGHLRYNDNNAITLCRGCHFILHHQDPKKIEEKIIAQRGNRWFKSLQKKSREKLFSFQTISWYNKQIELLRNDAQGDI